MSEYVIFRKDQFCNYHSKGMDSDYPPIALAGKTTATHNTADTVNHTATLAYDAAGHTTRTLAGIATTAVSTAAVAAMTTRISHCYYEIHLHFICSVRCCALADGEWDGPLLRQAIALSLKS